MKKTTKLLCGLLGVGLLLAGCATVSPIKNKDTELVYNGNSAVVINDSYLYYGNSFADYTAFENDKDYKASAKYSYLARLEAGATLSAKSGDYSPKNVNTVAKEVAVHEKSFMFALGDYIYYLTPNRKKFENEEGKLVQQYGYSTLYRSKLNGDKKKALYTTSAEVSQIEVLKAGNKYYIVMLSGTDLIRFELGSKVKRTTLAKDVTSVALPETYEKAKVGSSLVWNEYIYYTQAIKVEDNDDSVSGTSIKKIAITGGEEVEVGNGHGKTISFVGREGDVVFYSDGSETYSRDTNDGNMLTTGVSDIFENGQISDVYSVYADRLLGYIYKVNSETMYKPNGKNGRALTFNYKDAPISDYTILFVSGRTAYLSTAKTIYTADVSQVFDGVASAVNCTALVSMDEDSIYSGNRYAFDGEYLYYYAKLQEVKSDDEKEDESEEEKVDEHYYMYRTKVGTNADEQPKTPYELLSLTQYSERHSK